MDIDSRQIAKQKPLKCLLDALVKIKDLQPGIITRGVLAALAKALTPEVVADPDIEPLLERIGLPPNSIVRQRQKGNACDPSDAEFKSDARTPEMDALEQLAALAEFTELTPEKTASVLSGKFNDERKVVDRLLQLQASKASQLGKRAAAKRHESDAEKRNKMRGIWSEGNFSTKLECAVQSHEHLGMSLETARKALRRAPAPDPWPAKARGTSK